MCPPGENGRTVRAPRPKAHFAAAARLRIYGGVWPWEFRDCRVSMPIVEPDGIDAFRLRKAISIHPAYPDASELGFPVDINHARGSRRAFLPLWIDYSPFSLKAFEQTLGYRSDHSVPSGVFAYAATPPGAALL